MGHLKLDEEESRARDHHPPPGPAGEKSGKPRNPGLDRGKPGNRDSYCPYEQYFPAYLAPETPGIDRGITCEEYREAVDALDEFGLEQRLGAGIVGAGHHI